MRSILLATLACILLPAYAHAANINLEPLFFQIGAVQGKTLISAVSPDTIVIRQKAVEIIPIVQPVVQPPAQPRGAGRPARPRIPTAAPVTDVIVPRTELPRTETILETIIEQISAPNELIEIDEPLHDSAPTPTTMEPLHESQPIEQINETKPLIRKAAKLESETVPEPIVPEQIDDPPIETLHGSAGTQSPPMTDYLLLLIAAFLLLRIYYKFTHNTNKHD